MGHVGADERLVHTLTHGDQRHHGGHLIAYGSQLADAGTGGRAADQQLGVELLERIGQVLCRRNPVAVCRYAATAQQTVERLDRIARGTVYDQ